MQRQPCGKDPWSKSMHWHFDGALQQIWEFLNVRLQPRVSTPRGGNSLLITSRERGTEDFSAASET